MGQIRLSLSTGSGQSRKEARGLQKGEKRAQEPKEEAPWKGEGDMQIRLKLRHWRLRLGLFQFELTNALLAFVSCFFLLLAASLMQDGMRMSARMVVVVFL